METQVVQTVLEKSEPSGSTEALVWGKQMILREPENTRMVHLEKIQEFGG